MISMPGATIEKTGDPTESDRQGAAALRGPVEALAVGPRSLWTDGLDRAQEYIEAQVRALGYEPKLQTFDVSGAPVSNLEVELIGTTTRMALLVRGLHQAIQALAGDWRGRKAAPAKVSRLDKRR